MICLLVSLTKKVVHEGAEHLRHFHVGGETTASIKSSNPSKLFKLRLHIPQILIHSFS